MFKLNRDVSRIFSVLSSTMLLGFFSSSIHAEVEPIDFFCTRTVSEFKTRTRYLDRPEKTFIVWSSHIEGKSPEERCRESSKQFRINYVNGFKRTAVGQTVTGKQVICVVKTQTSDLVKCNQLNILFHLDRKDNGSSLQRSLEKSISPDNQDSTLTGQSQFRNNNSQPSLENRRSR